MTSQKLVDRVTDIVLKYEQFFTFNRILLETNNYANTFVENISPLLLYGTYIFHYKQHKS